MTIYIIALVLIYVYGVFFLHLYKNRKYFLTCSFITLSLFLGLRAPSVGEDTLHFVNIFNLSKTFSWGEILSGITETVYATQWGVDRKIENGYMLLNKVVSVFTTNEQWMIFIVAALTCGLFGRFIYKNTKHVFFATQIFICESLYMNSFNLMRQMLALAIALTSYELLKEEKYKKSLAIFVIAFLFHKSAIVLLVLIPLFWIKKEQRALKYVAIGGVIINTFIPVISQVVSSMIPRYSAYFNINYWKVTINGTLILWIIEVVICLYIYRKGIKGKEVFVPVACTILYLSLEIIGLEISSFTRVALCFRSFLILLFPCVIDYLPRKRIIRQCYVAGVISLLTVAFFSYASSDARIYQFFWV